LLLEAKLFTLSWFLITKGKTQNEAKLPTRTMKQYKNEYQYT